MNIKNNNIRKMNASKTSNSDIMPNIERLRTMCSSEDGASKLFGGSFEGKDVTAYVTLEPCCHYGQTPPYAVSLSLVGVKRVVVGFRDPNPRVDDGGGCSVLEENGITVDLMSTTKKQESKVSQQCARIVSSFVKRISPRTDDLSHSSGDSETVGWK